MYTLKLTRKIFIDFAKSGDSCDILNYFDIKQVFKKIMRKTKVAIDLFSTRSNFSKMLERLIFTHISSLFMKPKLSNL